MAVTLVLRSQALTGGKEASVTFDQPRVVIGRGDSCDFRIPEPSVSTRHASIRQRGTDLVLVDEGSTNGTFVGSVQLNPQTPTVLRHGSVLRFGRIWLEARIEAAMPTVQPTRATKDLALDMVARILGTDGEGLTPKLVVVDGPDKGREVLLADASQGVVLGRGRDVAFFLDIPDASRRHARVVRRGDVALLRDLGSRVGTMVGGELAPLDRDVTLRPGEGFQIGADVFVFEYPAVEALRNIERAEDEALGLDEEIDPQPESSVQQAPPLEPVQEAPLTSSSKPASGTPPLTPNHSKNIRQTKTRKAPWGKTDVVIVLLALVVFGLSAVGMVWLFRGE